MIIYLPILQRIYIGSSIYSGTNHMDSFGLRS